MICSREDEEKKKKEAAGKHLVVQRPPPQLKCASLLVTLSDKSDFDPQILNLRSVFGGLEQTIGWRGVTQSVNVKSVLISENRVDYLPYRSTALVAEAFKTSSGRLSWFQSMKVVWMSSYGMWYIEVGVRRGKIQKLFAKNVFYWWVNNSLLIPVPDGQIDRPLRICQNRFQPQIPIDLPHLDC